MAKQSKLVNIPRSEEDEFYRYKMPELLVKNEGKGNGVKSVIVNISEVARALKRPPNYLLKWVGIARGSLTNIDADSRAVVNGTYSRETLAKDLDAFIDKYVLCGSCQNPETTMYVKPKAGTAELRCKACGSITSLKVLDKFGNFVLKNPPKRDESEREHKAMESERDKVDLENDTETSFIDDGAEVTITTDTTEAAVAARRAAALGGGSSRVNALIAGEEMAKEDVYYQFFF
jgi:translation initiation factor 5